MSDSKTFPATLTEALAMAYVQSRDLSALAPEDIYDLYRSAYESIHTHSIAAQKHEKEAKRARVVQSPI